MRINDIIQIKEEINDSLINELLTSDYISFDFETSGTGFDSKIHLLGLSNQDKNYVFHCDFCNIGKLKPVFESSILKIAHNAKFDIKLLLIQCCLNH